MTSRTRSAFLASGALLLLAGCGGAKEATQDGVKEDIAGILVEDGYQGRDFSEDEADEAATCVAQAMFESDDFTKEERDDAASHLDGERHSEELVAKVVALVDECLGGSTVGPDAPSD